MARPGKTVSLLKQGSCSVAAGASTRSRSRPAPPSGIAAADAGRRHQAIRQSNRAECLRRGRIVLSRALEADISSPTSCGNAGCPPRPADKEGGSRHRLGEWHKRPHGVAARPQHRRTSRPDVPCGRTRLCGGSGHLLARDGFPAGDDRPVRDNGTALARYGPRFEPTACSRLRWDEAYYGAYRRSGRWRRPRVVPTRPARAEVWLRHDDQTRQRRPCSRLYRQVELAGVMTGRPDGASRALWNSVSQTVRRTHANLSCPALTTFPPVCRMCSGFAELPARRTRWIRDNRRQRDRWTRSGRRRLREPRSPPRCRTAADSSRVLSMAGRSI